MKVLFDEDVPVRIRGHIHGHDIFTVSFLGWKGTRNGKLMTRAVEAGFQVLVTRDAGLSHQRPAAAAELAIIRIVAGKGRTQDFLPLVDRLQAAIDTAAPGSFIEIR